MRSRAVLLHLRRRAKQSESCVLSLHMSRPARCGTASTKHLLLAMTFSVTQFGAHQVTTLLPWIYFYCSESTRHPYDRPSPHHARISCGSCLGSSRSCSISAQVKNIIRNSTSEPTPTQAQAVTVCSPPLPAFPHAWPSSPLQLEDGFSQFRG